MPEHVQGLIAAVPTPLNPDGSVRLESIGPMAAMLSREGVAGAFVCGTTGESLSLTREERIEVAGEWVRQRAGDFKVIVHVGHNSLSESRALARHAADAGAWGIAAMPPVFFRPATTASLVDWCSRIADAAPLPFYYYHLPSMTGVDACIADFLYAAQARIPTLAGVKFTSEDLMDFKLCVDCEDGRFDMLYGRDEMLLAALAMGARGGVGSTYSLFPRLYMRLIDAFRNGDMDQAQRLQRTAIDLVRVLTAPGRSLIPSLKAAMHLIDIECGSTRPPLGGLDAAMRKHVQQELLAAGLGEYADVREG